VNAAEQATSLEMTSKIAAIVNLFKTTFPAIRADLKPWMNDPDTRELVDPDSIDIGFHFPGRSQRFQSRSLLLQIRFHTDPVTYSHQAIGLEITGFDHRGKQWWFSTIQNWQFEGIDCPEPSAQAWLKQFCQDALKIFAQS